MLKPVSLVFALLIGFNLHAIPDLKTVGEGSYRYLFWQLYDARLATIDGAFSDYRKNAPVLLELTYKRDITKQQFIDATVDEWQKLGHSSKAQQQQWATQLQALWQDVKEGDRLAALLLDDGRVQFYFNGTETGVLEDTAFGAAFFDIWLHPDTSAPKLRRQLIAAQ
ncbi:MAG: chalcone isomerase family protein [Gammaproteobacteria bacterium]|nr:chalcone isomerase family protein [Gammaproteobacteria bacterium]MBU1555619.1 chalcone isomerase family protein [Gammaproteobacteria bacterium]MBU2069899.1 chalcone isomerase family protein [Gammaproteobacteria bacterium]MBU2184819.1 chalcone isomerase family protein [Gammaproteobacteria bacterium]MBU2204355.1 chalcone isomerase family protein [Gammaproteobacteria bacterium]